MQSASNKKDPVNILIVDDSPEKVLSLEVVLEELGERIVRAYSGREALRHLLNEEFAVILLDVNMPDMDGFETADLIRKRRSSSQTPIIFVTSFGDEMHAARGYSLGAVDYILAPVIPDVLRTKVMVFVDLFRKSEQLRQQAEALSRRATQHEKLAAAALAINADAASIEKTLQIIVAAAREIVGGELAVAHLNGEARVKAGHRPDDPLDVLSISSGHNDVCTESIPELTALAVEAVSHTREATRFSCDASPDAAGLGGASSNGERERHLAAPLCGRDGHHLGVLYLCGRADGVFTRDDEAVLVHLAQLASITVENIIFMRERDANRLKDEFLATLSHELRTPLSVILGWSELLKRRKGPDEIDRGIDVIQRNVKSQLKLIEDLLDVSRVTAGKLRLQMKDVKLHPLVSASLEAIKPTAAERKITIESSFQDPDDDIRGDADRLQQVVYNLLSNAVKFTPANGRVEVTVYREGDYVAVRVRDNGIGINAAFLPFVFERFRQADNSSTRSHTGLGIGLALVRHIIEMHGGRVAAHSEGEGKGATFTFTIPLRVPSEASGADNDSNHFTPRAEDHCATALKGMRVLLVEDVLDSREMLSATLRAAGAEVCAAGSAAEAIALFHSASPHVLVSDIGMPDESGHDLIRKIRGLSPETGGCIPAIALTAYVREDDRLSALSSGFQHHMGKPVNCSELIDVIASYATVREQE